MTATVATVTRVSATGERGTKWAEPHGSFIP
jgi:hypothetical protein